MHHDRARYFHHRANIWARGILLSVPMIAAVTGLVVFWIQQSPYVTAQDVFVSQPVPFSHEHHVSGLGIDCRFCHTSVDKSSHAGVPATKTCISCHSQIWTNAPMLEPVRESWRTGQPIKWNKVHRLPEYVYFNHQAHVDHGVGCNTCHGDVQKMPLMKQASPLTMSWCLDCHKDPAKYVRPREEVFNMDYKLPEGKTQAEVGKELVEKYKIRSPQAMMDCWTCHR